MVRLGIGSCGGEVSDPDRAGIIALFHIYDAPICQTKVEMSPHRVLILNLLQGWSGGGGQGLRGLVAGVEVGFPVGEAAPGAFGTAVLPLPPERGGNGLISFRFNLLVLKNG